MPRRRRQIRELWRSDTRPQATEGLDSSFSLPVRSVSVYSFDNGGCLVLLDGSRREIPSLQGRATFGRVKPRSSGLAPFISRGTFVQFSTDVRAAIDSVTPSAPFFVDFPAPLPDSALSGPEDLRFVLRSHTRSGRLSIGTPWVQTREISELSRSNAYPLSGDSPTNFTPTEPVRSSAYRITSLRSIVPSGFVTARYVRATL